MAKLLDSEYKLPERESGEGWGEYYDRTGEILGGLEDKGRIYSYPHADGHAYYYIVSEKPLVLQHVPYADAWHLDPAHIRGLRLSDIQAQIAWKKQMAELFK